MRTLLRFLLSAAAVPALLLISAPPVAADVGETIPAYDVTLSIAADGTLHVREQITYDFGSAERHGIYRTIPTALHYDDTYDRIYRLHHITVSSPSHAPTKTKIKKGTTTAIRVGDPDRTVHGRQVYVISYDVEGALNAFSDHEELYWNAIGDEWPAPISSATVSVQAPVDVTKVACFSGPTGSSAPCASAAPSGHGATFTQEGMSSFQAFTIVAAVPAGSVPAKPILEERFSFARAFAATPLTLGGLAALFALIGGGVLWLLWSRGRDRRYVGQVPGLAPAPGQSDVQEARPLFTRPDGAVEFAPPDGVRPGQVGTLIDEKADVLDVTATIVDLAVRKYLFIEELPRSNWFSSRDWRLTKLANPEELMPYERKLYQGLFSGRKTVLMSELKNKFAPKIAAVQEQLYDDAVRQGWFKGRPDKVRKQWGTAGLLLIAAGVGLTYLLAKPLRTHLALLGLGVVAGGIVLRVSAKHMPARTGKGSAALARVLGFRQYIRTAEVDQLKFEERESIFSRYLPYAIVFGETDRWAKAFASLAAVPGGTASGTATGLYWYSGPNSWDLGHFGSSMDSFTSSASGTLTSTPGGSGSSGFGGGGSSGGGGGGGGGGSW